MQRNEVTKRWTRCSAGVVFGVSLAVMVPVLQAGQKRLPPPTYDMGRTEELGGSINFEPNLGQADDQVKFMARGPGYTLSLTQQGMMFSFVLPESHAGGDFFDSLVVRFVGANAVPKLAAKDELTTTSSYFLGSDPKRWRTSIPNYARVSVENVYPGIDVMYRGTHGRLQCHFLIAPGKKPDRITLTIPGPNNPRLDAEGNLRVRSGNTELRLDRPTAYQDTGANHQLVSARYVVRGSRITIAVGDFDRTRPLAIDPVLNYAAYSTAQDATESLPPHFAKP